MTAEWVSVLIGGFVLAFGLIGNVITTIWWASRITTTLDILRSAVDELKSEKKTYATKEDVAREVGVADKEHSAIWKNIDEIKSVVFNGNNHDK